jgi:hypothetical protein
MPKSLRTLVCPAALALAGLLAGPAHADEAGKTGRVTGLRINTSGSADMASFAGIVKIKATNGKVEEYHWGGSTCPAQKLSDTQVDLLAQAMMQRGRTQISPTFVPGEASKRCLVSFELIAG